MKEPVLQITNVTAGYNSSIVLKNLSLKLGNGEVMAVMGPSGCGKSTLIKLIANLLQPFSGCIQLIGYDMRSIAVMFQSPLLQPWLCVETNVALPARLQGKTIDTNSLLTAVGLSGFEKRYPFELSGGEQRRVALARALAQSPSILCLDEPFTGVDELTRERLFELLSGILYNQKISCLFVSHNPYESVFLADRLLVLGRKPTTLIAEIEIDLERPRRAELMKTQQFYKFVTLAREYIHDST
ncbi:MAG: hypothetical protein A2Y13_12930 [Planctomycetes bacterium GWC2_45_44]|nr:MAG: hypothetical protein A2Y13_12930 [Planctomycetes bacterium GWC2_45_44]HBR18623.1 sulfonate ABC transporter ATP-binding protein [Phycisphaerales bacterium]